MAAPAASGTGRSASSATRPPSACNNNKLSPATNYYVTLDSGLLVGDHQRRRLQRHRAWRLELHDQGRAAVEHGGARVRHRAGRRLPHRKARAQLDHGALLQLGVGQWLQHRGQPKTITVGAGLYPELLMLRNVANLSIVGESRAGVIVGDVNFESLNSGSGASATSATTTLSTSGRSSATAASAAGVQCCSSKGLTCSP